MYRSFQKVAALVTKLNRRPAADRAPRARLQVEALDERLVLSAAHLPGPMLVQPLVVHHAHAAMHHPVVHGHKHGKHHIPVNVPLLPTGNPPTPVLPPGGGTVHLPPPGPDPDLSGDAFHLDNICNSSAYGRLQITKENADGTFVGSFVDEGTGHTLSGVVSGQITEHNGQDPVVNLHTEDVTFTFAANGGYEFLGLIQTTDKSKYVPSWQPANLVIKGMVANLQDAASVQDAVYGRGDTPIL
jgi:hypothetical protein